MRGQDRHGVTEGESRQTGRERERGEGGENVPQTLMRQFFGGDWKVEP